MRLSGYANLDFGLWSTAQRDLAACGEPLPAWISGSPCTPPATYSARRGGTSRTFGDQSFYSLRFGPGQPFDPDAATSLIRQAVGADGQFYEFTDTAFGGLPRYLGASARGSRPRTAG
jgi:hypothetical protein